MIPRAREEGRAYTLAVLAMYLATLIFFLMGVGLYRDDNLLELVQALPEYLLTMMVLGGAATAPNVAERIGWKGRSAAEAQMEQQARLRVELDEDEALTAGVGAKTHPVDPS